MTEATATTAKPAFEFEVKAHVTRELIKLVDGVKYYVRSTSAIYEAPKEDVTPTSRQRKDENGNPIVRAASKKQPPMLMDVIDLETGHIGVIIVPVVLHSELVRHYKDDSYVGRDFGLVRKKMQGKEYSTWEIVEVKLPSNHPLYEASVAPAEASTKKSKA